MQRPSSPKFTTDETWSPICPITSVGFWISCATDELLLSIGGYRTMLETSPSMAEYGFEYIVPVIFQESLTSNIVIVKSSLVTRPSVLFSVPINVIS